MAQTSKSEAFGGRDVPPATPPVVNPDADREAAATRPDRDGDSDFPGSIPDEVQPQQEPANDPGGAPDEVVPGQGDSDQPDSSPQETPPPPD